MRVRILKQADVRLSGEKKALFEGQSYELPLEAAEGLIASGKAVSLEPTFQEATMSESQWIEEIEEKAVHGPPEDKALTPQRTKRHYRRRG